MNTLEGKDFFDNIRYSVKISYFVASVIPVALLVYFSIKYVYPYLTDDATILPVNIVILLFLAVAVSVLGLILTTKATNSSISSAQDLNTKLNSLFEITKQFRETLYLDILLKKIMESAMGLTSAESGSLLLFDEQENLKFQVNIGAGSETMHNRVLRPGEGIASRVAETGQPALVNDISKDEICNGGICEIAFKTGSVICVPLIYSHEIIGVIELRNRKPGVFTSQDEALLYSLADQASVSIVQKRSSERRLSDFIHITETLVNAQDYVQNKKGHARRVASYANIIGKHLNCSDDELKKLYYACLLHDIGMLKIDVSESRDQGKTMYPKLGYEMIKPISLWSESAEIILHHLERYDGAGSPGAKQEEKIPLTARILSVADTFDALTSRHSDGREIDYDAALQEIEANAGTQFDPVVVQALRSSVIDASAHTEVQS